MKSTIKMMIFSKGKEVSYQGTSYIVDHVVLIGCDLFVVFDGYKERVLASKITCPLTSFEI